VLEPAPANLVDAGRQRLGRFAGPIARVNLIDAPYLRLPRPLRRLRLKEWEAAQIAAPGVFVNVALFDAKLLQLLQVKVYEHATGEKTVIEHKLRPGAFKVADQLLDSTTRYADRRGSLVFRNELARGRIAIEIDVGSISGQIELHTDRGASHVASLPFAGDVGMYSHKGMFPASGHVAVNARRHELGEALALLDDHKGYYPYVMRWDWVTAAKRRGGRAVGFNLTRNQCRDPERYNENCAWIDDRIGLLPRVMFEREHERQPNERWTIRDRDGHVDLTFEPLVPGDVRVNALIVESRYRGPFGTFTGRLAPEGMDAIEVDGWFGMGEDFHLRC